MYIKLDEIFLLIHPGAMITISRWGNINRIKKVGCKKIVTNIKNVQNVQL